METTSRKSIQHKIRAHEDGKPPIKPLDPDTTKAVREFLEADYSYLSKHAQLRRIHKLADMVVVTNEHLSVCRAGCSYCCSIDVEILPIEASYIEANTGIKIAKKLVKSRPKYCPLMDKTTGFCTVYKYRPFNCRTFVAYDSPDYCRDEKQH